MRNTILAVAVISLALIGATTLLFRKDLSAGQITVSDWMECYSTSTHTCDDISDQDDDYKFCKQSERQFEIETNPINCSQFWGFMNHAKGTEYINQDNLFSNCFLANEKEYQSLSYFFYTQVFYPRYHTCSGL
ncbi:hypothetical protein ABPG74_014527 [Tetrahymena malaccensis]